MPPHFVAAYDPIGSPTGIPLVGFSARAHEVIEMIAHAATVHWDRNLIGLLLILMAW
jgi:hypothetical protein